MDRPSDLPRHDQLAADDVAADEATANRARVRLRAQGIVALEPDDRIGVMLAPGERVVAVRRAVALERRTAARGTDHALDGDLYVTTTRLVHLGRVRVEVPIAEIREAVVAPGALLLVVGDGRGIEIRTGDPCVLRVEIAAVREAVRTTPPGSD